MSTHRAARSSQNLNGWGERIPAAESSWPLRLVDAGFFGLILLLPFIWGGRQALGNLATVLLSGWTAFWWAIHQLRQDRPRWSFSGAEPLFLIAILLVTLQTVALPESLKTSLSPQINQLLPAWGNNPETSVGLGRWSTLSFAPWQTWSDLITIMSVMLVFFIAIQRMETIQDVQLLMRSVAVSGCVTAVFGLVQYIFGNNLFFWFYENPDTSPLSSAKGAFTNANHFADFLAMSVPAQLWWYVASSRSLQKLREARNLDNPAPTGWRAFAQEWPPIMMLGITCVAILLSQSRGGLLIMGVGTILAGFLFWRQRLIDSRVIVWILGIAVCCAAMMMAFGDMLDKKLSADIANISEGQIQEVDRKGARQKIWNTDWKVIQDFRTVGTGIGTHHYVYESYHDYPNDDTLYTHAENGYLQVAMEAGITGLTVAAILIGLVGYWCIRGLNLASHQNIKAPLVVASCILVINLVHSCTDFIWYVPGCMVIVVLAAASACVLYRLALPQLPKSEARESGWERMAWGMMLVMIVAGLGWGVQVKWPEVAAEPHYHEYKRLANSRHDGDGQSSTSFEIAAILRAAQANPHDPMLQSRAARAHLRMFLLQHEQEHDLHMEEIRQAALASNYPSREALNAWLDHPEVMGENRRNLNRAQAACLRAMRLCPLLPRPYIESAKLAWLSLAPPEIEERLMKQALTARPFEGQVQLEYAHFLNNQGRESEAIVYYQSAYHRDPNCRTAIVSDLSPHYSPSFFCSTFDLDRLTLSQLRKAYAGTSDTRGYGTILEALAVKELEESTHVSGENSAARIVSASRCYAEMGDDARAIATLQNAIRRHGNSYYLRSNLANWLYDRGQFSEALPHLEWCHRRQPDNQSITKRIEVAVTKSDVPLEMAIQPEFRGTVR